MISDILKINRVMKITLLYVTNNYEEALSLERNCIYERWKDNPH